MSAPVVPTIRVHEFDQDEGDVVCRHCKRRSANMSIISVLPCVARPRETPPELGAIDGVYPDDDTAEGITRLLSFTRAVSDERLRDNDALPAIYDDLKAELDDYLRKRDYLPVEVPTAYAPMPMTTFTGYSIVKVAMEALKVRKETLTFRNSNPETYNTAVMGIPVDDLVKNHMWLQALAKARTENRIPVTSARGAPQFSSEPDRMSGEAVITMTYYTVPPMSYSEQIRRAIR